MVLEYIKDIMPVNSGFEGSDLYKVMLETVQPYFNNLDDVVVPALYDDNWITKATSDGLDRLGEVYGVKRGTGESDDDYRTRLGFQADRMVNLGNVLDLGCEVYSYTPNYDLGTTLLSRNVTEAVKLLIVTPNPETKELLVDNLLSDKVVII